MNIMTDINIIGWLLWNVPNVYTKETTINNSFYPKIYNYKKGFIYKNEINTYFIPNNFMSIVIEKFNKSLIKKEDIICDIDIDYFMQIILIKEHIIG